MLCGSATFSASGSSAALSGSGVCTTIVMPYFAKNCMILLSCRLGICTSTCTCMAMTPLYLVAHIVSGDWSEYLQRMSVCFMHKCRSQRGRTC